MSFSCQRCRQPLLLAPSLSTDLDLNQSAYDLVQDSFIASRPPPPPSSQPTRGKQDGGAVSAGSGNKQRYGKDEDKGGGAAEAGRSQASAIESERDVEREKVSVQSDPNSLSARLAASAALFDLFSHPPSPERDRDANSSPHRSRMQDPNSSIDHPLCKECTDSLLELMDAQLNDLRRERDALLSFEAELKKYEVTSQDEKDTGGGSANWKDVQAEEEAELMSEIEKLTLEESRMTEELRQAEARKQDATSQLKLIEQEEKDLRVEEETFWAEYSRHSIALDRLVAQQQSLQTALRHDSALLARLQLTNVYNDAFCIGHDGGFATINGLRLGRLPGANVEWNEINAAWGQTALLLTTLARKLGVTFKSFKVVPKGSFSTICRLDGDKAVYELYGSGDWQIGRLLQSRRFDHGMVAFLDCLKQVCNHVCERDEELRLPHAINKDRIGEACIRLQFGQDETWTRALRHVLITLKMLLSWTVQNEDVQGKP